jgi:methylglutaconyl-CoA hydratase
MPNLIETKQITPEIIVATLNRPEKRNALNCELMQQTIDLFDRAEKDLKTRIIIFKGAGTLFCAGLDLDEVSDPAKATTLTDMVAKVIAKIYTSPIVTIALAHGAAIAGGAGLIAACDFAVGTPELKFGFPEVKRGIIPSIISTILARQLGWRQLRELFLLGNTISGAHAAELGLLNTVVSDDQLESYGLQLAQQVLEGAPQAIRATKQLLNHMYSEHFEAEVLYAQKMHKDGRSYEETIEGIRAFHEKRKPSWDPRK